MMKDMAIVLLDAWNHDSNLCNERESWIDKNKKQIMSAIKGSFDKEYPESSKDSNDVWVRKNTLKSGYFNKPLNDLSVACDGKANEEWSFLCAQLFKHKDAPWPEVSVKNDKIISVKFGG